MPHSTADYVSLLLSLRSLLGARCTRRLPDRPGQQLGRTCPRVTRLEFAHLLPTKLKGEGRGARQRCLDILRNPHAYGLVCRTCHRRLDAKTISPTLIPSIAMVARLKSVALPGPGALAATLTEEQIMQAAAEMSRYSARHYGPK